MGEEYSERAPFEYFVSHGDPSLVEAVRQGRKDEFAKFGWTGEIPDPQSEATFLDSKLNWDLQTAGRHRILWDFYQELLRIRRNVPPLTDLDKNAMEVSSFAGQKVLLVRRWKGSSQVLIVCHFGQVPIELPLPIPPGHWHRTLDSADERWGDKECEAPSVIESRGEVNLPLNPWAFLVFAKSPELKE
jgi:maltooligosyltrehalose trehalohydrolase